jgi:predicted membrane channel-forming protein YqfA (hemolysin III family)
MGPAPPPGHHGESDEDRSDRNLGELLQELRVAGVGVQVLTGFLLSLPFTTRFSRLGSGQLDLYLVSLVLAVAATALLMAPVAYHRLLFHRGKRASLVRTANAMAIAGLAAVSVAICAAVALVTSFVAGEAGAVPITAIVACLFAALWFAYPLSRR